MKDNVKRVFYVRYVAHPCYLDIIAQRPEIRLDKLENDSADDVAEPIIAAAHAYQIGSARDELKPRFYAQRELIARKWIAMRPSLRGSCPCNGRGRYHTWDVLRCGISNRPMSARGQAQSLQ